MNTNEQLAITNLCKMHKRKKIFCRFTQKMCDTISSQQTKTQERTCVE